MNTGLIMMALPVMLVALVVPWLILVLGVTLLELRKKR